MGTQFSLSFPVGNYIPICTPKLLRGLPSRFLSLWCRANNLPFKTVTREPKPLSLPKIVWKQVCNATLCHWAHELSLGDSWQSQFHVCLRRQGRGWNQHAAQERCKFNFKLTFENEEPQRELFFTWAGFYSEVSGRRPRSVSLTNCLKCLNQFSQAYNERLNDTVSK
jgi:hypothetical protein